MAACSGGNAKPGSALADSAAARAIVATQEALRDGDFAKYASMLHPDALAEFRYVNLPAFESRPGVGPAIDPREVFGPGVESMEDVRAIDPQTFFAKVYGTFMMRTRGSMHDEQSTTFEPLRCMAEGSDSARVIVSAHGMKMGVAKTWTDTIAVKRDGDQWKPMLFGGAARLVAMLRADMPPGAPPRQ